MLPSSWVEQHVPDIFPAAWTGDVWKLGFELTDTDNINFVLVKVDHGIGVVRIKSSSVAVKNYNDALKNKNFDYFFDNLERLPLIHWDEFREWQTQKAD
jgi:hypothetical protein